MPVYKYVASQVFTKKQSLTPGEVQFIQSLIYSESESISDKQGKWLQAICERLEIKPILKPVKTTNKRATANSKKPKSKMKGINK